MLLATIAEEPGLSQTELANRVGITEAAMSRNMDTLGIAGRRDREGSGLGWITSQDDPADDRPNRVYLTDEGQRALQTMLGMLWP
jgi:DNA-binding MarR family transcriptional regulator